MSSSPSSKPVPSGSLAAQLGLLPPTATLTPVAAITINIAAGATVHLVFSPASVSTDRSAA